MTETIIRTKQTHKWRGKVIGGFILLCVAYPIVSYMFAETSGVVVDAKTGRPIEGAYVLASYNEGGSSWGGHSASWCVRTAGMYTGSDGKFRFPSGGFLRLNQPLRLMFKGAWNESPSIAVIKPDYYLDYGADREHGKYVLLKQDPAKPEYQYGNAGACREPESRKAAEANVTFLKIKKEEYLRFARGESSVRNIDEMIQRLENIPVTASNIRK
jgi:hypothetical protein